MIRICFVSSFPPSHGRLSEYAYFLVNEMQNIPAISHIYVIADINNDKNFLLSKKITVIHEWKPDFPTSILKIIFRILQLKPDIVNFNIAFGSFGGKRPANFVGLALPFLCRLLGFRTVVNVHSLVEKVNADLFEFELNIINRLGVHLATKLLALSTLIIVMSQSYVTIFKKKYHAKNVIFIPHGTKFTNKPVKQRKSEQKKILCIGYHSPKTDLDLLFESFKIVSKEMAAELIIAGESHPHYGDVLSKYRSLNIPNVSFIGYVPDEQLQSLFEKVDLVVLPYRTCTGVSGVAHLACSFGIPIIATDLPELREHEKDGMGMLLTPRDDPTTMAQKILSVLNDPSLAEKLRNRCINFSKEHSWSAITKRFNDAYQGLMNKKLHSD